MIAGAWLSDVQRSRRSGGELPEPSDLLRVAVQVALDGVADGSVDFCRHVLDDPDIPATVQLNLRFAGCAFCDTSVEPTGPCFGCGGAAIVAAQALIGDRLWLAVDLCRDCAAREGAL